MNTSASAERITRLETAMNVVLDISRQVSDFRNLRDFFHAIRNDLSRVFPKGYFQIALLDRSSDSIRYVYDADEVHVSSSHKLTFSLLDGMTSPTAWVIRNGTPTSVATEALVLNEVGSNDAADFGKSQYWLGFPLIDGDGYTIAVIVLQGFEDGSRYSDEDVGLYALISSHLSHAIGQVQITGNLERIMAERTSRLEKEVVDRRHGETLQHALFEISALSVRAVDLDAFYFELHHIMEGLLYAKNMIVTLYHESEDELSIPYFADEKDPAPARDFRRPRGHGLTGFIISGRKPQRIDQARYRQLVEQGSVHSALGSVDFNSFIGAPMIFQERLLGAIILQSYDSTIEYDDNDLALLTFVADHIAAALVRKQTDDSLREKNIELLLTLEDLRRAQDELVRKEKLASLGSLVAGVAHEINTPIGVAITAASHLEDQVKNIAKLRLSSKLTVADLDRFEALASESSAMVLRNLRRADELIRNFKQVAVDQSSNQKRSFELKAYIDEVMLSLQPKFRHTNHKVHISCPEQIVLDTYPAAIYQILVNLVMNSLIHGFENRDAGEIDINVSLQNNLVKFNYSDNGCGMSEEIRSQIFEPFFTTRRGRGGTGLGMHIVHNLVTQAINGKIEVSSSPGGGATTSIVFPATASTESAT